MLSTQIARYVSLYRSLGRKFSEQERLLVTSAFSLMPRTQTTKSRLSAFSAGGSGHVPLRP